MTIDETRKPHPLAKPERNKEIARRIIAGEKAKVLAQEFQLSTERVFGIARQHGYTGRYKRRDPK